MKYLIYHKLFTSEDIIKTVYFCPCASRYSCNSGNHHDQQVFHLLPLDFLTSDRH